MRSRRYCYGLGPKPSRIFLCGEKPGETEIFNGRPFSGKSGEEQNLYLRAHSLSTRNWYITNVVKHYIGDRSPTPEEILAWEPTLLTELDETLPELIIAVGAVASRYFLGDSSLDMIHGMPHRIGAFDSSIRRKLNPIWTERGLAPPIVVPIFHPALGFRDPDARSLIAWDYGRVADAVVKTLRGEDVEIRRDEFRGREHYTEVDGDGFVNAIRETFDWEANEIAIDTEGWVYDPFSLQASWREGEGYFVRVEASRFTRVTSLLQLMADKRRTRFILHNAPHDIPVLDVMGVNLTRARIWDTMYAAYLTRIESYQDDPKGKQRSKQGLKPLAYRHCGMEMRDHDSLTAEIGYQRRLDYLNRVLARDDWPHPGRIIEQQHDGRFTVYRPNTVNQIVNKILGDVHAGKLNNKGEPTDIEDRWRKIHVKVRKPVEDTLGPLPYGSVRGVYHSSDQGRMEAVRYGCQDSDATLRLKQHLRKELRSRNLLKLFSRGMAVLPAYLDMAKTGLFASRSYFEALRDEMWDDMMWIGERISREFMGGEPFNPKSPDQTRVLMERRGVVAAKLTKKTGKASTDKKSILHLRYTDDAMGLLQDWREREHNKDAFCEPVLRRVDEEIRKHRGRGLSENEDLFRITCQILNTRTATRRLATRNLNFLAIPVRTELGNRIRQGFIAPRGYRYVSADLSQIEFRILADECGDPTLIALFNRGDVDVHGQTAAWVFGVDYDVTMTKEGKKKYRAPAKTVNYGLVYLQTGFGMADTLRKEGIIWTPNKCEGLIRKVHDLYPGIPRYIEKVRRETLETEMACSRLGMPRYLPGIKSRDRAVAQEALRHAMSQRIQGTASDAAQESMIWLIPRIWELREEGYDVNWCLWIHDEIMMLAEERVAERVLALLIEGLARRHGMRFKIPIEAEGKIGKTWGELK